METHSVRVVPTGEDGEIAVYSGEQNRTLLQVNIASNKINSITLQFPAKHLEIILVIFIQQYD